MVTFFNMRIILAVLFLFLAPVQTKVDADEQAKAVAFLDYYNDVGRNVYYKYNLMNWLYETNITKYNEDRKTLADVEFANFSTRMQKNASKFQDLDLLEPDAARQIRLIRASGSLKSSTEYLEYSKTVAAMVSIYSTGKWQGKNLEPGLGKIIHNSRNFTELFEAWQGWRNVTGPKIRPLYKQFVELSNKGARENGWKDTGEWWRSVYEVDDLQEMVEGYWNTLKPLYLELHAYTRYKLRKLYGEDKLARDGYIPAHVLGNMWAQDWGNIYDLLEPFKNKDSLDVTKVLVQKNYTIEKMVETAQEFFVSIGLEKLPASFWSKSMIKRPGGGREVVCHASAWDFYINRDVRIKQCVELTHNHLVTLHHELGHIQYFLQYINQSIPYRDGANPGFHEAVGDLMSLSVDNPSHLKKIGLLLNYEEDEENDINALMKRALDKVAFIPFGYLIDQWRWSVFSGKIKSTEYNTKWWELRKKYQGIDSYVPRTEEHFDPGAKFHIPNNTPYIRYFMSFVLQFQLHQAACKIAGHEGPLHKCSIYKNKEAGKKIGDMLKMGRSRPWPEALKKLTGSNEIDVNAITEYFMPLCKWMVKQRKEKGYPIGWNGQKLENGRDCSLSKNKDNAGAMAGPWIQLLFVQFTIVVMFCK